MSKMIFSSVPSDFLLSLLREVGNEEREQENRGISKSILHFILHFILHSTILYSTLYSTQQFGQDVDVIDNFDIN